ncbi:keratin-associated protein 5-4-like [Mercenaria mercenaria]|uniref:keratin-associated protein 5-4-like n=1 Tax=Mercenaria mercenaria TaxID=6596 RepID=UPI00234E51EA|nr:keratin-associated protein 5-4-like [Mercenaria mercenaria]
MAWIGYLTTFFSIFSFISSGTEQKGRCTCSAFRCQTDRVISGSCHSAALPGGWGVRCCKPYCLCKGSCQADESDEGRYGTALPAERDATTQNVWNLANRGSRGVLDSCPANQSFCCPNCRCQKGVCDVKEISTRVKSCGTNHKLCCQPQASLYRPWPGCKDSELPLTRSGNDHTCGLCQCKKYCEMQEVHLRRNTCGKDRNLCCKLCTCKSSCLESEINIGRGHCGYRLQLCCRACICKTPCNAPEELIGPEGCFYGETVCCKT